MKVSKENAITAYKMFNQDWTCRNFQFQLGNEYFQDGIIELCENGFHACMKLENCFNYYSSNPNNKVAIVELYGEVVSSGEDKIAASNIKIMKVLSWLEVLEMVNTGKGNSGYVNSGDRNSGHRNTGYRNSGDGNSGNENSGNDNSGYRNSGLSNSGCGNSGLSNSGDFNSGSFNSGCWNSGDWNSGYFNIDQPKLVRVFGKYIDRDIWDNARKPEFLFFSQTKFIKSDVMTDEEKSKYPDHEITGGYLKELDYKEAFQDAYNKASEEEKEMLKALPNFDADIFFEISGIRVE